MAGVKRKLSGNKATSGRNKKISRVAFPDQRRITRAMTADATQQAVLNTPELLENIFIHLSPVEVLFIQRVCGQFRAIVQTSPILQQLVFARSAAKNGFDGSAVSAAFKRQDMMYFTHWPLLDRENQSGSVRLNTLLVQPGPEKVFKQPDTGILLPKVHLALANTMIPHVKAAIKGERQWWMIMQLTDPPLIQADVQFHFTFSKGGLVPSGFILRDLGGITLAKTIEAIVNRHSISAYGFEGATMGEALLNGRLKFHPHRHCRLTWRYMTFAA